MADHDIPQVFRDCDTDELLAQLGTRNVLGISGGRISHRRTGVTLLVTGSWMVTVDLAADDTYYVRRVRKFGPHCWGTVGAQSQVYCEDVAEVAYNASCFVNIAFGKDDPDTEPGIRESNPEGGAF